MIVSHNELVAAVNKAFFGMQRSFGEADVIANMVADLQMVGLRGVQHFNNASRFIGLDSDCAVSINKLSDNTIEVDLKNSSVACHLPAVLDYALENMVGAKSITLELKQCHNRWLGYSELVRLAAKGIACRTRWSNGSSPKHVLYVLGRGCIAPEVFFSDNKKLDGNGESDNHTMTIELSVNDFNVEQHTEHYSIHINGDELSQAESASWQDGVFVEDEEWQQLKQTAAVFLVENSERSVQGAGELV